MNTLENNLKDTLLNGEVVEFANKQEDFIAVWFQKKTNNFCIELNGKVISSLKSFKIFISKLGELLNK